MSKELVADFGKAVDFDSMFKAEAGQQLRFTIKIDMSKIPNGAAGGPGYVQWVTYRQNMQRLKYTAKFKHLDLTETKGDGWHIIDIRDPNYVEPEEQEQIEHSAAVEIEYEEVEEEE